VAKAETHEVGWPTTDEILQAVDLVLPKLFVNISGCEDATLRQGCTNCGHTAACGLR